MISCLPRSFLFLFPPQPEHPELRCWLRGVQQCCVLVDAAITNRPQRRTKIPPPPPAATSRIPSKRTPTGPEAEELNKRRVKQLFFSENELEAQEKERQRRSSFGIKVTSPGGQEVEVVEEDDSDDSSHESPDTGKAIRHQDLPRNPERESPMLTGHSPASALA